MKNGQCKGKEAGKEPTKGRKKEKEVKEEAKILKEEWAEQGASKRKVSTSSSIICPSDEETYGFLTYVDDVGLVELKEASLLMIPVGNKVNEENDRPIEEDQIDDDP